VFEVPAALVSTTVRTPSSFSTRTGNVTSAAIPFIEVKPALHRGDHYFARSADHQGVRRVLRQSNAQSPGFLNTESELVDQIVCESA